MPRFRIRITMFWIVFLAFSVAIIVLQPGQPRMTICVKKCPAILHSIALGLMTYHREKQRFPSGTHFNTTLAYEDRLSWYAQITGQLDNEEIHDQIEWDQPWNVGMNKKLSRMYLHLNCPNDESVPNGPEPSSYIGIAGFGKDAPLLPKSDRRAGVFGYDRQTTLADIKDGAANTMLLAETTRLSGSWMQGGPATVRGLDPGQKPYIGLKCQFGGLHQGGVWIAMADGSVRMVSDSASPKVFEALSTMAGGETLPANW